MYILSVRSSKKLIGLILIALCSMVAGLQANAQTGAWNTNTFKFTKDISALESMAGATNITFTGVPVQGSTPISFGGFDFKYGLSTYSSFYVSPLGFIKLGSNIVSNTPEQDSKVIVPLNNGTVWNASHKLTGTAPNRKMVIQFSGVMQPSGELTSFQVWLYERTGTIQFVYEKLRGFYSYPSSQNYKIFCSTPILNAKTIASLKVNSNNSQPTVNYTGIASSYDSIYANTRFTFQPDTIKPSIPTLLNFTNVQPGCLTVNFSENATNESVVVLERTDTNASYSIEKLYYPSAPASSTSYNYAQTLLQPSWNYNYRFFVTNGFMSSDTLYHSIQTSAPQLDGIKTVPGDYPSITALLQDAPCKHIGSNLVIELQSNYSFAVETLPLTFGPSLRTRLIQSVTIRPAANTTINWTAAFAGPLFYVDSVCHVFLDGRPGGVGSSQNLILTQNDLSNPVIQYTNAADSGGINYCKIIRKGNPALILVVPNNYTLTRSKKDINAFSITNNFIAADAGTAGYLIFIRPSDALNARDFVISGNQFSRFRTSAIHFEGGGENLLISNNRFFQPDAFSPYVSLSYSDASCITLLNTGKATIDNNYFGGSTLAWGVGKFIQNPSSSPFSFINCQNTSAVTKLYITNNKFGNIENNAAAKMINLIGGDVLIDNNRFGTADSINSITYNSSYAGIYMSNGTKTVSNNFFSGIQGGYFNNTATYNISYFVYAGSTDSSAFIHNDFGGSDNPAANSTTSSIYGIYMSIINNKLVLRGNIFRGISSRAADVDAINGALGMTTAYIRKLEIDSNSIHHIIAAGNVAGIRIYLNSRTANRISYNNIYALKTQALVQGPYAPTGRVYGIVYSIYDSDSSQINTKGGVSIFGNKIHSFESLRTLSNSSFSQYGIVATSPSTKIYNNELRLGITTRGHPIDQETVINGIAINPIDNQSILNDKHYIEHNTIFIGGQGRMGNAISCSYSTNYFTEQNNLTLTNNIINVERTLTGNSSTFISLNAIRTYSAKNIWYSSSIPTTPNLLQNFQQTCGCDQSSFIANPYFPNPTGDSVTYNLRIGPNSPGDRNGTPSVWPISTDLEKKSRKEYSPTDIGAYAVADCGNVSYPELNIITPQYDSLQLCNGVPIILTAGISGGQFNSVQWQRNLTDISGANNNSITITTTGNYRLVGKTNCGEIASKQIYVTNSVLEPVVTITASDTSSCSTVPVTFTAAIRNVFSPIYQWIKNGVNIPNANNSSYISSKLFSNDTITCTVVNNATCPGPDTVTSNMIIINKNPITSLGADTTVYLACPGETANLNLLYNISGLLASWSSPTPLAAPSGFYQLVVTNNSGCSDTANATIKLEVATWNGLADNNWHNPANWNINKVPTTKTHVIISSNTTNPCGVNTANAVAASVQLRNGATVTISTGYTLTTSGNCTTLPIN